MQYAFRSKINFTFTGGKRLQSFTLFGERYVRARVLIYYTGAYRFNAIITDNYTRNAPSSFGREHFARVISSTSAGTRPCFEYVDSVGRLTRIFRFRKFGKYIPFTLLRSETFRSPIRVCKHAHAPARAGNGLETKTVGSTFFTTECLSPVVISSREPFAEKALF